MVQGHEPEQEAGTIHLLGVRIDRLRLADVLDACRIAARARIRTSILYVNIHCMNVANRDAIYCSLLDQADLVYCDGTGVRLGARIAHLDLPERMTGADWIGPLAAMAQREHLSLFLLGDRPGIAEKAAAVLRVRYPRLRIAGTAPGYALPGDITERINQAGPDILLVGMGTPRQEQWIADNREALDVPVIWAVGALFGFVSGTIPRGPRWMTQHGLEWLCRLATEPRKLWRRYLFGNPLFFWRIIRRYRLDRG